MDGWLEGWYLQLMSSTTMKRENEREKGERLWWMMAMMAMLGSYEEDEEAIKVGKWNETKRINEYYDDWEIHKSMLERVNKWSEGNDRATTEDDESRAWSSSSEILYRIETKRNDAHVHLLLPALLISYARSVIDVNNRLQTFSHSLQTNWANRLSPDSCSCRSCSRSGDKRSSD